MGAEKPNPVLRVGIVGPCASGKSTLKAGLERNGYEAHHIAQEHSHVPDMWLKITNPDRLIFLDAALDEILRRRETPLTERDYRAQQDRLRHARENADLILETGSMTVAQVLAAVLDHLRTPG